MLEPLLRVVIGWSPPEFDATTRQEWWLVYEARRDATPSGWPRVWLGLREMVGAVQLVAGLRRDRARAQRKGKRGMMMGTMLQDARYAWRGLRKSPAFTASAVIVLALGIGANTAIFSAANAFFFRPLPFADPDRLVMLYETNPEFGWVDAQAAPANVLDWREGVEAFDDVSGYSEFINQMTVFRDGEPMLVGATAVVGNFFSTLGVPAALGRTLSMDDTWGSAAPTVVISHNFWESEFGADPGVVGTTLDAGDTAPRIVGVMPEGFGFPSDDTQAWYPYGWDEGAYDQVWFRRAHFVRSFARLAPDVGEERANEELQAVVQRLQVDFPETNSVMGAGLMPMRDFLIRGVRTQLLVLLGAVVVLLLLACANVANLMLVRANDRSREVAVRQALGAGRARVVRQALTESGLIAVGGAAVGLAVGTLGVHLLTLSTPLGIEGATRVTLDLRVVAFTLGVALVSGLVFGTAPAMRSWSSGVEEAMREGSRGNSGGRRGARTVRTLVAAEMALALLLVVGAGLMVRTFVELRSVYPGFERAGVVAVQFTVPNARYPNRDQVLAFHDQVIEQLEARPGVVKAGTVGGLPLAGAGWSSQFQAEGWPPDRVGFEIVHRRADADYFEAVGTPLIRGRMFDSSDGPDSPLVVVINETFAAEHFPGEDPIGQRIAYDRAPTEDSYWYEIIGIVGDQHQSSPREAPRAEVFEHRSQDWDRTVWVVVQGDGAAESLMSPIRAVLAEMDPLIPIARTRTLQDVWRDSMAREEFLLKLLAVFASVAMALAAVGVYGVTAQATRRRTQEIGIRMALGASARDVLRLVLRHGAGLITAGLGFGLLMVFVAGRVLAATLDPMLFGVQASDPLTVGTVVVVLGGVALWACYLPARRATRLDPVSSLRTE